MKLFVFLFVIGTQVFASSTTFSQDTRISLDVSNGTLMDIFSSIEEQSEFRIFYRVDGVNSDKKYNVSYNNETVGNILSDVLKETDSKFELVDKIIVITNSDMMQEVTITGQVTDANTGEPMVGTTVTIEGTTIGQITDLDGNYSINVPNANAVLVYQFIGYNIERIAVGSRTNIDVALVPNIESIDEVVVVGYGAQSKRTVTGSVQAVNADELADMPVTSTAQKLQGKLSGVQISQTTGKPGEALKIRVRGQASLTANNDPLYVVDGFPISGDINSINPNEIESISVLKDASSAALYGSRAANGVVLVTTKRGKLGKTSVSLSSSYGWQVVPEKGRPEVMNGVEYATFQKESYEDRGQAVPGAWQNPEVYDANSDYYDALLRVAPMQDHSISFSSSKDNFRTTAVLGYTKQDGVLINSDYARYSLRINSDFQASKKLSTGFSLAPTYSIANSPTTDGIIWGGGLINSALTVWPIFDYENEDGTIPYNFHAPTGNAFANPIHNAEAVTDETRNLRLLSNAYAQYEPIEGLVIKTTINFEHGGSRGKVITPSTVGANTPSVATGSLSESSQYTWLNENTVSYKKSFGDHNFDGIIGMSVQKFVMENFQVGYRGFSDDRVPTIDAAESVNKSQTHNGIQKWAMMSYLGRINYNFQNRYLLSFALRSDGSSRFGSDNRWGYFPSASAGWIVSDEAFMSGIDQVSLFKLRASYGVVGNNNIGNYTQFATVGTGAAEFNAIFGENIFSGSRQTAFPNTTLTWEQTAEMDFGFDLGLLNSRVNLTYDFYNRKTTSLLYQVQVAQESGFQTYMTNVGELQFWGHEIMLNTRNFVGDFSWETSFNISFTDNKVNELTGDITRIYSGLFESNITKLGDKVGLLYGMVWDGVYDNQTEYDNSPHADLSEVGTIKFKDVNGDGRITHGGDDDDRTVIGDPTPKFTFGLTNTFSYKNFDLAVVMSGSFGNDLIVWLDQSCANLDGNYNVYKDVANRWRSEDNPGDGRYGKAVPGLTGNERDWPSSRFISDASHLSIKNVTLGYTINTKVVESLRVFMSIQQLYTFTNYRGVNPEAGNSMFEGGQTTSLSLGSDFGSYPVPRTISFGLNVGF